MKSTGGAVFYFIMLMAVATANATTNFISAGAMSSPRMEHTSTLLPNGKVLIAGGTSDDSYYFDAVAIADLYNPTNGLWRNTGTMIIPRCRHTAALLSNGKVLVVGGDSSYEAELASAELYDPVAETWTNTGSLNVGRELHAMTVLANGKVLVTGGYGVVGDQAGGLADAELYDPATETWTNTGSMNTGRFQHTSTLLPDGKVLVVGGLDSSRAGLSARGYALASAELYDPATEKWTYTYPMSTNRYGHTATLLPNGKVLVTGGSSGLNSFASAELYDPATETWSVTDSLCQDREWHNATLLTNGTVLVTGGDSFNTDQNTDASLDSSERYHAQFQKWTRAGRMTEKRDYGAATTLLPNGKVLITGGQYTDGDNDGVSEVLSSAELYDPGASSAVQTPPVPGITLYNGQPVVFFPTTFGVNYQLQMSTDLDDGDWTPVTTGTPVSGLILTNVPANAFFRLQ